MLLRYVSFIFSDRENSKKMDQQRKKTEISSNLYGKEAHLGVAIVAKSRYLGTKCFRVRLTWNRQALVCALVPKASLTQLFIRHANKK